MTDFDLERELTNLLHDKSETMPHAVDSDPAIVKRARSRRNTKLASIGGGSAAALALVVGLVAINGNDPDEVKIQPAPPGPTTETERRVLDRGAIVAARTVANAIVELDAEGNELRELATFPDYGAVLEIDAHPNGNELYVRVAEEESCGQVLRVDLRSGEQTEIGEAAGVAISGNGAYVAFSTNLDGGSMACRDFVKSVVLRNLAAEADLELVSINTDEPDGATNVALNDDATRFAYEQCWERCVVYAGEFEAFDCFTIPCDRDVPTPEDLQAIQGTGTGSGASVYEPAFISDRLFGVECDCEFESEQAGYRLAEFDPMTGQRGTVFAKLSDDQTGWAMLADGAVIESTSNGSPLFHVEFESMAWPTSIAEIAVVPIGTAFDPRTPTPETTPTTTPTTPADFVPLATGAIVAARPDGVIVELDTEGNELRELYDAGSPVRQVVAGESSLLVVVDETADRVCGRVRQVDLVTQDVADIGEAVAVAASRDFSVIAFSADVTEGTIGCDPSTGPASVVVRHMPGGDFVTRRAEPSTGWPGVARNLALSRDGSILVFEDCFEGCGTLLATVPVACLGGEVDCDLSEPPTWDELVRLDHDGSGYGAGAYLPSFQGEVIVAAVCDCEVEAGSQNYRLVSFDAQTGEQLNVIQDLPDGVTSLSVAGSVVLVGINNTSIIRYTDEPFTFPGEYTTATMVPVIAE